MNPSVASLAPVFPGADSQAGVPVQCGLAGDLDFELCDQARRRRDRSFDGVFFTAVRTTGIYCRPICPAQPHSRNVCFYRSAASAEADGFRPCLRCRPESAPFSPAWNGTAATVARALRLIAA